MTRTSASGTGPERTLLRVRALLRGVRDAIVKMLGRAAPSRPDDSVRPSPAIGVGVNAKPAGRASCATAWQVGDLAWIVGLDGVTAGVVASATPRKVTLAMGSARFAYERGFSPSDPTLFHSKDEARRYLEEYRLKRGW